MTTNKVFVVLIVVLAAAAAIFGLLSWRQSSSTPPGSNANRTVGPNQKGVAFFSTAEEFKAYLALGQGTAGYGRDIGGALRPSTITDSSPVAEVGLGSADLKAPVVDRVSTTNVQVKGIDEPDIVKTDGKNLFVSTDRPYLYYEDVVPLPGVRGAPTKVLPQLPASTTSVLNALPPETLARIATIPQAGNLLLSGSRLMVFTTRKVYGYDIADTGNPKEVWTLEYGENNQLEAARLKDGKVYLVTSASLKSNSPCPFTPFKLGGEAVVVPCTAVLHPVRPVDVNVTYTALVVDPSVGTMLRSVSFVGASGSSVVAMFDDALYVTYPEYPDYAEILYAFYNESGADLLPAASIEKIKKLRGYDLSVDAKLAEIQHLISVFEQSLSDDEQLKYSTEVSNRMKVFDQKHRRDYLRTGIVKIGLNDLQVEATGAVPGTLLSQFSLDVFQGALRVATTVGTGFLFGSSDTVNDVYTLDGKLAQQGSVLDLGKGERIYAVRFVGTRGYVVTFKQTDPFYVLDLSDPKAPVLKGELKIPGFSSYLDPLTDTLVAGVGQENFKVKVSLFDVRNPAAPTEVAKYELSDSWSDVQQTHHAFLHDAKHEIFFLPAGANGYVFSYADQALTLKKAVADTRPQRAVYINDFLYVVGDAAITVVDENNWQTVKEFTL